MIPVGVKPRVPFDRNIFRRHVDILRPGLHEIGICVLESNPPEKTNVSNEAQFVKIPARSAVTAA